MTISLVEKNKSRQSKSSSVCDEALMVAVVSCGESFDYTD
jgi:hypothetical protein